MKWTDTGRGYSVGCICAACAEEAREEARVKNHEPSNGGEVKSHKEWQEEWDEATDVLRALRATRQPVPETVAPEMVRRAVESFLAQPLCAHTRKKEAREPAPTHLTADRLALVGVILSMLRDKLPSNAVRIAVEIEFADGGECKMESKA